MAIENADISTLRSGMDLTLKALLKVAENNGLKPLDPLGQPFNPELHQAMSLVDAPQAKPNDVVAVMQKGYVLNDRLLRPALVAFVVRLAAMARSGEKGRALKEHILRFALTRDDDFLRAAIERALEAK